VRDFGAGITAGLWGLSFAEVPPMHIRSLITLSAALFAVSATTAMAQAPAQQPMFATTKVDGTDNVYIFRYQNHQAMFVVRPPA
jgi:hypothetical protein